MHAESSGHRYHVTVGMYGYIPNAIYAADTLAEARRMAAAEAANSREAGAVRGNARDGYEWGHDDARSRASMTGFFGYIGVERCEWDDCEVGDDE